MIAQIDHAGAHLINQNWFCVLIGARRSMPESGRKEYWEVVVFRRDGFPQQFLPRLVTPSAALFIANKIQSSREGPVVRRQ